MRIETLINVYQFYENSENFSTNDLPKENKKERHFWFVHFWILPHQNFLIAKLKEYNGEGSSNQEEGGSQNVDSSSDLQKKWFIRLCSALRDLLIDYENSYQQHYKNDAAKTRLQNNLKQFREEIFPLLDNFINEHDEKKDEKEGDHDQEQKNLQQNSKTQDLKSLDLPNGDNILHAAVRGCDNKLFSEVYKTDKSKVNEPNNNGITPGMLAQHILKDEVSSVSRKNIVLIDLRDAKESPSIRALLKILFQEYFSISDKALITSQDILQIKKDEKIYEYSLVPGQSVLRYKIMKTGDFGYRFLSGAEEGILSDDTQAVGTRVETTYLKGRIYRDELDIKVNKGKNDRVIKFIGQGAKRPAPSRQSAEREAYNTKRISEDTRQNKYAQAVKIGVGRYAIKMRRIYGRELPKLLGEHGEITTLIDKYKVALGIGRNLQAMHTKGFLHLDLHDHQIMVDIKEVKGRKVFKTTIFDFGSSREFSQGEELSGKSLRGVNYTIPFSAPEIVSLDFENQKISTAADRFAYGVILLLLLVKNDKYAEIDRIVSVIHDEVHSVKAKFKDVEKFDEFYRSKINKLLELDEYFDSSALETYNELIKPLLNAEAGDRKKVADCISYFEEKLSNQKNTKNNKSKQSSQKLGESRQVNTSNTEKVEPTKSQQKNANNVRKRKAKRRDKEGPSNSEQVKKPSPIKTAESRKPRQKNTNNAKRVELKKSRPRVRSKKVANTTPSSKPKLPRKLNYVEIRLNEMLNAIENNLTSNENQYKDKDSKTILLLTELGELIVDYRISDNFILGKIPGIFSDIGVTKLDEMINKLDSIITSLLKASEEKTNIVIEADEMSKITILIRLKRAISVFKLNSSTLIDNDVNENSSNEFAKDEKNEESPKVAVRDQNTEKLKTFIIEDLIPYSFERQKFNRSLKEYEHKAKTNSLGKRIPWRAQQQGINNDFANKIRELTRNYFANPKKNEKLKQGLVAKSFDEMKSVERLFPHRREILNILSDLMKIILAIPSWGLLPLYCRNRAEAETGRKRYFSSYPVASIFHREAQRTRGAHECLRPIEEALESIPIVPATTA